jgi:hypothetical protein
MAKNRKLWPPWEPAVLLEQAKLEVRWLHGCMIMHGFMKRDLQVGK